MHIVKDRPETKHIEQWWLEDKIDVAEITLDRVAIQLIKTSYAMDRELDEVCDLRDQAMNILADAKSVFNILDEAYQYKLEEQE